MLIDTHAHIYATEFEEDRKEVLQRAKENGVQRIYMPNIDSGTLQPMLQLYENDPDFFKPMIGLHPCYIDGKYKGELRKLENILQDRIEDVVAIGETGLDFVREDGFVSAQKEALRMQCAWAKELDLPIILHSRGAIDATIQLIKEEQDGSLRGIFHCFTGNSEQAERIMDLGFLMGIGGILTFKNADLDKVVRSIPLEKVVLETDAPYLAPHPHRGKRNEPAFLSIIAEKLAEVYDIPLQKVAKATSENALQLFGEHK